MRLAYIALVILAILGGYLGSDFLRSSDSPRPETEQKLVYFQLPTSRGGSGLRARFRPKSCWLISGLPGAYPAVLKSRC